MSPPVVESASEQVTPVISETVEQSPVVDISETDPTLFDTVTESSTYPSAPIEVISADIPDTPITITREDAEPAITVTPTEELGSVAVSAGVPSESPRESIQSQESVDVPPTVPATPPESVSAMMPPVMHPVTAKKSHKTLIIA